METDAEIMAALQAGDENAFEALVGRWQRRLLSFAMRSIGSREDGLDVVQETFVRIYKQRTRYQEQGAFSSWIFRIASNICRNEVRWRVRHPSVAGMSEDEDALPGSRQQDPGPSPFAQTEAAERALAVRSAVAELPEPLRMAVHLFDFEGLSQRDIAIRLGCSAKAVETRIYRARKILKKRLAGWKAAESI